MCSHEMGCHGACTCQSVGVLSVEDEIKMLDLHRAHLQLQLEQIEKRISGLKRVGK
jgi:hypothetical protein